MTCKLCGQPADIPVKYSPEEVWSCDSDYAQLAAINLKDNGRARLNSTVDSYTSTSGKVGKITAGKDWEIKHRRISRDDGRTVINSKTGKEAQY